MSRLDSPPGKLAGVRVATSPRAEPLRRGVVAWIWLLGTACATAPGGSGEAAGVGASTGAASTTEGKDTASATEGSRTGADDEGPPGMGPDAACPEELPIAPGAAPIRRLTRFEYDNTVRDLLGDDTSPSEGLPPDELGNGFGNDATSLRTSSLLVEAYDRVAAEIALRATDTPAKVATLLGCDPAAIGETPCVSAFLETFGSRAFRRPMAADDKSAYLALYADLRATTPADAALRGVLRALLQAPSFLYRVEWGRPVAKGEAYTRPDPYEMATRLSYLLWGSMPDAALFEAAREGRLETDADVRKQAERLLADDRSRAMVRFFHGILFRLSGSERLQKNPELFPGFVGMSPWLKQETETFLDHVIWEGDGTLTTMLSANYSFMNDKVAAYYGLSGPKGSAFERVELPADQRSGLLTQAIVLSLLTPGVHTNPTIRGLYVLENLLCRRPPDPPPGVNVVEPAYDPGLTTRERFEVHTKNEPCRTCHKIMDPIGFALENYDAVGLWRVEENGKPIDATANLMGGVDVSGPIAGPTALAQRLANSDDVRRCMVRHWFTFAYGRPETPEDRCAREALEAAFATSEYRIRDLILALTETHAFRYRPVSTP